MPTDPKAALRWWTGPDARDWRFISGVFEGGGAKGLLYAGALEAVAAKKCWFDAVAGASAGAITATLIASGMTPEEIADQTEPGLEVMRLPGVLNGILRIRAGTSYLNQEALLIWLQALLAGQMAKAGVSRNDGDVDFQTLYAATGIELNVVAVDLNREQHVVFNHLLTPKCEVARAVVASAAIPVVFEWIPINVPQGPLGIAVDGGVAANFPTFVFTDPSFRAWANLPPQPSPVVGFLLDEAGKRPPSDEYHDATLSPPLSAVAKSLGMGAPKFRLQRERGMVGRLLSYLFLPIRLAWWPVGQLFFRVFPWLLERNAGVPVRTWDHIENRRVREAALWFDRVLVGVYPWFFFLFGFLIITFALGFAFFHMGARPLVRVVDALIAGEIEILSALYNFLLFLSVLAVGIYAWVVLVGVFSAASVLHRSARVIGYGLLRTFLWGAGAPPWCGVAEGDNVVKLRVPDGVTTLGVKSGVDVKAVVAQARESTETQLDGILSHTRST